MVMRTSLLKTNQYCIGVAVMVLALILPAATAAAGHRSDPPGEPTAVLLSDGLAGGSGSTVGPGHDIYVTEGLAGRVSRIDPDTGEKTTYATGLPAALPSVGIGGAMDVEFLGKTAYVLVTLVGSDLGGNDTVGIYRVDGPNSFTVIADIGTFSLANPPTTSFFIPTGVQYALESYRGGFLVTDGHHNRVLRVTLDGQITEVKTFGNIVPTGMALRGGKVYMTEAGPVPHLPENGKIVSFRPSSPPVKEVASGARLLVDVEIGRGGALYALSQGFFTPGNPEGSPAEPDTGALVRVDKNGSFTTVIEGLDQPTSFEFVGDTAYVVGLPGEIWRIENVNRPHVPGH
jgi:sugar lactone lactonase YvrE